MNIIEITAFDNGAHRNQQIDGVIPVPEGWAIVPDELECENFPFGNVTVEEKDGIPVVVAWKPLPIPEPEPVEYAPTMGERLTTLEDSNAEMAEALDLLLSGVIDE